MYFYPLIMPRGEKSTVGRVSTEHDRQKGWGLTWRGGLGQKSRRRLV